jgi:hypothetical protein
LHLSNQYFMVRPSSALHSSLHLKKSSGVGK